MSVFECGFVFVLVFNDEEEGVLDLNLYSPLEHRHIETVDDA